MGDQKPRISLVIPHCPSEYHDGLLKRCVDSFPDVFETIVVVNEFNTIGFTKAVNHGLKLAKGDYVMVVNNDIKWVSGELESLCVPDVVTSPTLQKVDGGLQRQNFWGFFFVIPKTVLDKVGLLDDQFYLYCSDTDYYLRLKDARVERRSIESCVVFTEGGQTTKDMVAREKLDQLDTKKFIDKWGFMPNQAIN